jgi:hypothetical protein
MKKIVILAFVLLTVCSLSFAQNSKSFYRSSYESRNSGSFSQEHSILSLGYGFGNQFYGFSGTNRFALGPFYVKYEHGFLRDEVGLGGHIAFANAWVKYNAGNTTYKDHVAAFSIAFLGYYHFNKLIPVENLDVYAGVGLSVWTRSWKRDSDNNGIVYNDYSDTNVYAVVKVGARYYIKPTFGFYGEVGYDQMSTVNLGVTFKF